MFIFGNFLYATAVILSTVISLFQFLLFIRFILSWVNPDPYNIVVRVVFGATEPLVAPFRRLLPMGLGGLDFSLMFAFLFLIFAQHFLVKSLFDIAARM
jgi:YggT family protein